MKTQFRLSALALIAASVFMPSSAGAADGDPIDDTLCTLRSTLKLLLQECESAPSPSPSATPTATPTTQPEPVSQESREPKSVVPRNNSPVRPAPPVPTATSAAVVTTNTRTILVPVPTAINGGAPVAAAGSNSGDLMMVAAGLAAVSLLLMARKRPARAAAGRARLSAPLGVDAVSNLSHELRTPLTPVKGYAAMLANKSLTPEQTTKAARQMLAAADQLDKTTDLLVTYAALRAGDFAAYGNSVDVFVVANDVAEARRADRRVIVRGSKQVIEANERLVRIAVEQLVDNAIKFSPGGGDVTIVVARAAGNVEVTVRDQGIGIATSETSVVFKAFRQLDASPTRAFGGLGLGLTVVNEIAKMYKGSTSVRSTPGVGSSFTLAIPAAA